jgi:hypothetical protein
MTQADGMLSTPRLNTATKAPMKITRIDAPMKHQGRITTWSGLASGAGENYEWFYTPRQRFAVRKQEPLMPKCWMYVDPPRGLKPIVLKAVRAARLIF